MKKRLFSLILAFVMALGMVPSSAFAAGRTSEPVTAYLSMSDDAVFLPGQQGVAVALQELTVPYFDLKNYGLEKFYFQSETYESGELKPENADPAVYDGKVTVLHMMIYATEVLCCQVMPSQAGNGYLKNKNMMDQYFMATGNPGSLYMTSIWNMDQNLNYYVNHAYPLASPGLGSTMDQILLREGDVITLGHFSDTMFFQDPRAPFNHIEVNGIKDHLTLDVAEPISLQVVHDGGGVSGDPTTYKNIDYAVDVYTTVSDAMNPDLKRWKKVGTTDTDGQLNIDAHKLRKLARGSNVVLGISGQFGQDLTEAIVCAPAVFRLDITDSQAEADKQAAAAVDARIAAIGKVTLESEADIKAARAAYDKLTPTQKNLVTKLSVLEDAEAKLAELKEAVQAEADQKAAAAVDAQIAAIGKVTLESEADIKAARAAYDKLTPVQQKLVTKLGTLEAAEAKLIQLKEEAAQAEADKQAAAAVDAQIVAIGEVTLESEADIKAARAAYTKLTPTQKKLVTKLNILEVAEARLARLKEEAAQAEADKQAAAAVDAQIAAIGKVTLESEADIKAAREYYDSLTPAQKKLVKNLSTLEAAEAKLAELKEEAAQAEADKQAAAAVDARIAAIGKVTLESEADIKAARAAYDKLTPAQQKLVKNLSTLEAAEAKLAELKEEAAQVEADKQAAAAVDAQIAAIGKVTLESEADIKAARAAYDKLTPAQQKLVTKLSVLEAAEAKLAELKEEAAQAEADKQAAAAVDARIAAIGEVTLESEADIKAARAVYDKLTPAQKKLVKNLSTLEAAEAKLAELKQPTEVDAYWPSFRGNDSNMAIVSVRTPTVPGNTELKWNVKMGEGWAAAPSPMIIVDNAMIVLVNDEIYKLSLEDGSVLAQGKMAGKTGFSIITPTYGSGMIFCPLDKGKVQAFDAKTLEPLWLFQDELQGQPNCPITYADGMVYTGFWNSETKDANYVALDVRDDNPAKADEAKEAVWTKTAKGGYYWAGSVVVGDAVIFGTDDGTSGTEGQDAHLYALDKKTGTVISDLTGLTGDQRSSIAYSAEKGRVYFTTKGGYLYSAAVDAKTGKLSGLKSQKLSCEQSTSTPVVYGNQVYLCCGAGVGGSGENGFVVADADTLQELYDVPMRAYPQCSPLVSTAYLETDGRLYIYLTYNSQPGGITLIKVDPTQSTAKGAELVELYDAKGFEQYCICSIICDENGTLYYKNDSCNIMAVGRKAEDANVKQVEQAIDKIGTVTLESKADIEAARAAYDTLSPEAQAQVSNYEVLTAAEEKLAALQYESDQAAAREVDKKIDAIGKVTLESEADIKAARTAYDKLTPAQKKLVTRYDVLVAAEKLLSDLKRPADDTITVTFRLIGAKLARKDVDFSAGVTTADAGADYQTWIKTDSYTLDQGAKVYDLFMMATEEAGLRSVGANKNYVSTIYAPDVCGGYELSEFTNGARSGWMYTLNGDHPNLGLCEQTIKDGDVIIWHYINDYAYEVRDWFDDDPNYPAQGDSSTWVDWDKIPDVDPQNGSNPGGGGFIPNTKPEDEEDIKTEIKPEVKPDIRGSVKVEITGKDIADAVDQAKKDKTDVIVIEPVVKGEASRVAVELPKSAVALMARESKSALIVRTELAQVTLSAEAVADLAELKGETVTVTMETILDKNGKDTGMIRVEVTVDGKAVDKLADGVTVVIPVKQPAAGMVAVLVTADGKKIVLRKSVVDGRKMLGTLPGSATIKIVDNSKKFDDLNGHWGRDAAAFASARELFQGVTASSFAPDAQMTRAMLATVLWRLEGEPAAKSAGIFRDVAAGAWYTEAVSWAAESKIVNGYNGHFNPDAPITRQQLAAMMYRYADVLGLDRKADKDTVGFSDHTQVADWARDAMNWAVSVGLLQGKGGNLLDPTGFATRAEVAAICQRMVGLISK